jgi:hypothetical protein
MNAAAGEATNLLKHTSATTFVASSRLVLGVIGVDGVFECYVDGAKSCVGGKIRRPKVNEARGRFFEAVEKGGKVRTKAFDILEEGLRPLLSAGGDNAARIFTEGRKVIVAAGHGQSEVVQEYYDRFYPMIPPEGRNKVWGLSGYAKEALRKEAERLEPKRGFLDIIFGR